MITDADFIPSLQPYPEFAKCCLVGEQRVPVRRNGTVEYDDVAILLAVVRLNSVGADLLITVNALAAEVKWSLNLIRNLSHLTCYVVLCSIDTNIG